MALSIPYVVSSEQIQKDMKFDVEKPFALPPLPPKGDFSCANFADDLIAARVELAELKGSGQLLPNPLLLLSPAVLRESIASSEIENIHTTIFDALQMQLLPEGQRPQTDKEVLRYRDTLMDGFGLLDRFAVCTRVIHQVYRRLLPESDAGYRKQQNRIISDKTGATIYTPPPAHEVPNLIRNWEQFINSEDREMDPLVKAAMAHYQFEAIHPFGDGNGRCGRILIELYLVQAGVLQWPILFISGYLIRHRTDYYRLLKAITENGDWEKFIRFMLRGFHEQARETRELLVATMSQLEKFKRRLQHELPNVYSHELVEALFSTPIITPSHLARDLGIHYRTAGRYLGQMEDKGLLKGRIHGKYHLFFNNDLIELLRHSRAESPSGPGLETIMPV